MPWTPAAAKSKTHKASTPAKRRRWSKTANAVLKSEKAAGKSPKDAERIAIATANKQAPTKVKSKVSEGAPPGNQNAAGPHDRGGGAPSGEDIKTMSDYAIRRRLQDDSINPEERRRLGEQLKRLDAKSRYATGESGTAVRSDHLFESIGGSDRVDEERGIIYGLCILGPKSVGKDGKLRRRYSPEAMESAVGLYEGILVNADHPPNHDRNHDTECDRRLGKFFNVRYVMEGGVPRLRGDLAYFKQHPLSGRLVEAATRKELHDAFGFSHDVDYDAEYGDDGVVEVKRITRARTVDLVADPATTHSLFESRKEGTALMDPTQDADLSQSVQEEEPLPDDNLPSPPPVAETPVDASIENDPLDMTVDALFSQYLPDIRNSKNPAERKKLAKELGMKVNDAVQLFEREVSGPSEPEAETESEEPAEPAGPSEPEETSEEPEEEKTEESAAPEKEEEKGEECKESKTDTPAPPKSQDRCSYDQAMDMLTNAGVEVTKTRVKQLRALESTADREEAIKDWKSLLESAQKRTGGITTRSGSPPPKPHSVPALESKGSGGEGNPWDNQEFRLQQYKRR